ncbi:MAG: alpha/beta hydrolase [Pseudomonadota bacterium]
MTHPALPLAVEAEQHSIDEQSGRLSYYVAGDGPPVLLLHSINAAGSVYEVKPIFEGLASHYRVYAPDLPGFGFSDRSRRDYDIDLYIAAIVDMLNRIAQECGEQSVHAIALSLTSEFLARAAATHPSRFRSVTLVNGTGFTAGSDRLREPAGSTREMAWLAGVLELPIWRGPLYRLLASPGSIRFFLKKTFGSPNYDEGLAHYDELTTQQPGAENAPYAFLSGRLFSKDIRNVYEQLKMPVWLPHGTRGDFKDFRGAAWTQGRDNWTVNAFETGALPHFEQPDSFMSQQRAFLSAADQRRSD